MPEPILCPFQRQSALRALLLAIVVLAGDCVYAQRDSWSREPINYVTSEVNDPVAKLAKAVSSGEVVLQHDQAHGYLKSVLKELGISQSSQSLVFSKTSLQLHRISPRQPRALYFNDDVYVGFCQQGDVLEFAATDAIQAAIFYTLSQEAAERPVFVRDKGNCLTCHATSRTQDVPGYLVRSVYSDRAGRPKLRSGTFTSDHTSDFKERWGGWYVSGTHGTMRHMGNSISRGDEYDFDYEAGANDTDLRDNFATARYLTPHSDLVALMVLAHQTQMHNALAFANYETRLALHQSFQMNKVLDRPEGFISETSERRISKAADRVLQHLFFCDEFPLTDPVAGTTSFAEEFVANGPFDSKGRSLRQFDLSSRMFRYPCSYLIYAQAFHGLPLTVKSLILKRMKSMLKSETPQEPFAHLTFETRKAIHEILQETHPDFQEVP